MQMLSLVWVRRHFLPVVVSATFSLTLLNGCSTVHVRAHQASIADDTHSTTVVALWWGAADPLEEADCGGDGLKLVSVSSNWLYSLCAVVTLGAVVPMDVEYRCTQGELEGGDPLGYMGGQP